ncbi:Gfo/Idh/MocA family protein [Flagellimonas algicola]|uniref:Gfo/Idh/MocA family oxidoreductase n=1 Tax=Flagellimonas algicola TaxID=2583815 RepID=A0ABY2WHS4_9FLAO|nr:Gfo/Idh/MocA family oxidoreductase [Allomuricauda algicola]TMU50715.1 Gfo/Idh/MocA family oxidoreductase [Allomuricauda algicola]
MGLQEIDANKHDLNRRNFMSLNTKVAAFLAVAPSYAFKLCPEPNQKLKIAIVGTGIRALRAWGLELVNGYSDHTQLVGLCDANIKRAEAFKEILGIPVKLFPADQFVRMIKEQEPHIVLVATTDNAHSKYIIEALKSGCDVITEKPIAIDETQCQDILDAEKAHDQKVYVGFNVRYMNDSMEMKRILDSKVLGKIISVGYQEYLDNVHGASYYRRWHGKSKYSGSLFVHKSSHHFDLVNWLLDDDPVEVKAMGGLQFYGANNDFRGRNCRNCDFTEQCDFYWDITKNGLLGKLYTDCEGIDNYYRDGCVWDKAIDAPDSGSILVRYGRGAHLNYSFSAYLPYEGQYISFSGEKGRLDVRIFHKQTWMDEVRSEFRLSMGTGTSRSWVIKPNEGAHGGADARVKDNFFKNGHLDPMNQRAGSRAGIMSSLVGIAAMKSIDQGRTIRIDELMDFS